MDWKWYIHPCRSIHTHTHTHTLTKQITRQFVCKHSWRLALALASVCTVSSKDNRNVFLAAKKTKKKKKKKKEKWYKWISNEIFCIASILRVGKTDSWWFVMFVPRHRKGTQCHALLRTAVHWDGQSLSAGTGPSTLPAIIIHNSVEIITFRVKEEEKLSVSLATTSCSAQR